MVSRLSQSYNRIPPRSSTQYTVLMTVHVVTWSFYVTVGVGAKFCKWLGAKLEWSTECVKVEYGAVNWADPWEHRKLLQHGMGQSHSRRWNLIYFKHLQVKSIIFILNTILCNFMHFSALRTRLKQIITGHYFTLGHLLYSRVLNWLGANCSMEANVCVIYAPHCWNDCPHHPT